MIARPPKGELDKRIAGAVFVLFWIVAIAAWIVAGTALGNAGAWQPFIVDIGIVIASVGHIFGDSWPILEKWIGRSGVILLTAVIVVMVIGWRIKVHRDSLEESPDDSLEM